MQEAALPPTRILLILLSLAPATTFAPPKLTPESATIRSGVVFNATDGAPVHAHGAGLLLPQRHPAGKGGLYYMVGTSGKTYQSTFSSKLHAMKMSWLSDSVTLYSSYDLEHWTFVSTLIEATALPAKRIERPKIIYNKATATYVMYMHLDDASFTLGQVAVCRSKTVEGPYTLVDHFQPDGKRSLDMTLFQDDDDAAFLVRSVDNKYVGISQLSADYLRPTGIAATAPLCEGNAVWREGDELYLLGSHLTGWAANPAILQKAHAPLGKVAGSNWTVLGNPSGSGHGQDHHQAEARH